MVTTAVLAFVVLLLTSSLLLYYSSHLQDNATSAQTNTLASNNSNYNGGSDTNSGIDVNTFPIGIAVNPSTNKLYVVNEYSNTVSVIDTNTDTVKSTISLGNFPYGIDINPLNNRIYITNRGSNTVSVLDGSVDTKLHDIAVGKSPVGIAVNPSANWIYVTNLDSDTVSVIDTTTNEVISNITSIGDSPVGIAINSISNKLYVSNIESNTVAVIDTNNINSDDINNKTRAKNNTALLKEIKVNPTLKTSYSGEDSFINIPADVGFPLLASQVTIDSFENSVYITNTGSNTITIIDGKSDEVAIRLTFNINPPNTGEIQCNNLRVISGNSTSYNRGQDLQCIAAPERGYSFSSWSDLGSGISNNPLTIKVSKFGTLTANFRPAITPETYVFAIGGIVGAASVLLGWYYKYGQRRYVNRYLTRIQSIYDTLHEKDKQQCILQLQS